MLLLTYFIMIIPIINIIAIVGNQEVIDSIIMIIDGIIIIGIIVVIIIIIIIIILIIYIIIIIIIIVIIIIIIVINIVIIVIIILTVTVVIQAAYSEVLSWLVSVCDEPQLIVWDCKTSRLLYRIEVPHGPVVAVTCLSVASAGYRLVTGAADGMPPYVFEELRLQC